MCCIVDAAEAGCPQLGQNLCSLRRFTPQCVQKLAAISIPYTLITYGVRQHIASTISVTSNIRCHAIVLSRASSLRKQLETTYVCTVQQMATINAAMSIGRAASSRPEILLHHLRESGIPTNAVQILILVDVLAIAISHLQGLLQ